jgi:hypothetical protein
VSFAHRRASSSVCPPPRRLWVRGALQGSGCGWDIFLERAGQGCDHLWAADATAGTHPAQDFSGLAFRVRAAREKCALRGHQATGLEQACATQTPPLSPGLVSA